MLEQSPIFDPPLRQLKWLNELSTQLQSLMDSDGIYQEIVRIVEEYWEKYWQIHRQRNGQESNLKKYSCIQIWSMDPTSTLSLRAQLSTKQEKLLQDAKSQLDKGEIHTGHPVQSTLRIPILNKNEVLAVLSIESHQTNAFDKNDQITLEAIGSQIAVALVNRKLYQDTTHFNQKLQQAVEDKTLELRRAHERILEQQKHLQKENKALKNLVYQDHKTMEIVGSSAALLNVIAMVDKIAPTTATVLIQGESGTGKELIARQLHFKSERAHQPYVTVNCGALQESLLESELFGHEKGAFTGAVCQKMGLSETADGGTLFLDELGELSLGIQAKLLRFLQEGEFYRVGGKRPIQVDVRVISATNRDLEKEVKAGRFREDLFYRLNTITLKVPPLRKRIEDIGSLVDFFLKNSRVGHCAHPIKKVDPRVLEVFSKYSWPGNIRELQNTIERLKILAENHEIRVEDIPFSIRMPNTKVEAGELTIDMPLEDVEKNHILRTLAYNHGNKTKTAHSLKITIKTLYNKLHRYGILQPQMPQDDPDHRSAV
jgi:two-component system response regulator HydG